MLPTRAACGVAPGRASLVEIPQQWAGAGSPAPERAGPVHAAVQDHRKRKQFLSWPHADSQSGAWLLVTHCRSSAASAVGHSMVHTCCKPLIRSDPPHCSFTHFATVLGLNSAQSNETTNVVQRPRTSGVDGDVAQMLVFGWLAGPTATVASLAQTATAVGVPSTPQALRQRITSKPCRRGHVHRCHRASRPLLHLLCTPAILTLA